MPRSTEQNAEIHVVIKTKTGFLNDFKYHFAANSARPNYNYGHILTSVAPNAVCQFHIGTKFPHMLDYLTNLQSELVCWRDAKALKEPNSF